MEREGFWVMYLEVEVGWWGPFPFSFPCLHDRFFLIFSGNLNPQRTEVEGGREKDCGDEESKRGCAFLQMNSTYVDRKRETGLS